MIGGNEVQVEKATPEQVAEAEESRRLGFQELQAEMISSLGAGSGVAIGREVELNLLGMNGQSVAQSLSSEAFRGHNESMAHS